MYVNLANNKEFLFYNKLLKNINVIIVLDMLTLLLNFDCILIICKHL